MNDPARSSDTGGNEVAQHLRGSTLLFLGRCVSVGMNFAVQLMAVRYLSKSGYGVYAVAFSIVAVASVIATLGTGKTALRVLPKYLQQGKNRKFTGGIAVMMVTALLLSLCIMVVIYVGAAFGAFVDDSGVKGVAILLILVWVIPCNVIDSFLHSLFSVIANPRAVFLRQHILGPGMRLVAAVIVIVCQGGIVGFAVGQMIAALLGVAIYLTMLRKVMSQNSAFVHFRWPDARASMKEIYSVSCTLLSGDLAFLLRSSMVVLFIGMFHSHEEVAAFQAVFPAARLNEIVLATFTLLFMSNASRLYAARDSASLSELYCKTITWTTVFSFPLFAVSFALAEPLTVFLFGSAYSSSGPILAILSLGFFLHAIVGVNLRLLRATSGLRVLWSVDLVGIAVALLLNCWLIPKYGALGGAIAVCGSFLVQGVCCQLAVWRTLGINPFQLPLARLYGVAAILGFAMIQLSGGLGAPPVVVALAIVLAAIGLLLLNRRELDIAGVFPELGRTPLIGRLLNAPNQNT